MTFWSKYEHAAVSDGAKNGQKNGAMDHFSMELWSACGFPSTEKKSITSDETFYIRKKRQLEEYCTRIMRQLYSLNKDILVIEKAVRSSSSSYLNSKQAQGMMAKKLILKYIWICKQLKGIEQHNKYRWMQIAKFMNVYKQCGLNIKRLNGCCSKVALPVDKNLTDSVHALLQHIEMSDDMTKLERANQDVQQFLNNSSNKMVKLNVPEVESHINDKIKKPVFSQINQIFPQHYMDKPCRNKKINLGKPRTKLQQIVRSEVKPNLNTRLAIAKDDILRETKMALDTKFDSVMESLNAINQQLQNTKTARHINFDAQKKNVDDGNKNMHSVHNERKSNVETTVVGNKMVHQQEKSTQVSPKIVTDQPELKMEQIIKKNLGTIESFQMRLKQLQEEEDKIRHHWNTIQYEEIKAATADSCNLQNPQPYPELIMFTKGGVESVNPTSDSVVEKKTKSIESSSKRQFEMLTFTKDKANSENKAHEMKKFDSKNLLGERDLSTTLYLAANQVKSIKRNKDKYQLWKKKSSPKISIEELDRVADQILNKIIEEVADELSVMAPTIINDVFNREFKQRL